MKIALFAFAAAFALCAAMFGWHPRPGGLRARPHPATEKWVDANHLQVLSRGRWQEVDLMPLADHLCQSGQPLFERYCTDPKSVN
jgi:hypothetical protein